MNNEVYTPHHMEIVLREGQFVRRTVQEELLGSQQVLLAECANQQKTFLPRVILMGDKPVSFLVSKAEFVAITYLDKIPFNTWYMPGNNRFVPVFLKSPGAVLIKDDWIPPSEIRLCFALAMRPMGYDPLNAFLFAEWNKELYRLPYPNVYENGKICMGGTWQGQTGNGPAANLLHAIQHFYATQINSDLTTPNTKELFAKTMPDGKWAVTTFDGMKPLLGAPLSVAVMSGYTP